MDAVMATPITTITPIFDRQGKVSALVTQLDGRPWRMWRKYEYSFQIRHNDTIVTLKGRLVDMAAQRYQVGLIVKARVAFKNAQLDLRWDPTQQVWIDITKKGEVTPPPPSSAVHPMDERVGDGFESMAWDEANGTAIAVLEEDLIEQPKTYEEVLAIVSEPF